MTKTLTQKLRESGVASPESDRITQILAKDQSAKKPHKHKWFTPEGSTIQRCRKSSCPAHRKVG